LYDRLVWLPHACVPGLKRSHLGNLDELRGEWPSNGLERSLVLAEPFKKRAEMTQGRI
jgi:hypothetical protein